MAKGTYFQLAEFVDPIDKTEFENWISWATTVEGIKDIWSLLGQPTTSFGALIETSAETVFKEFWPTWKQQAEAQIGAFRPDDPDKPTPEEQMRIDAMVPEFLAAFPSAKSQALQKALENVRPKSGNDWRMLEAASSLAEVDARDKQDTAFYESLAAYYITVAARYVAARSVRYDFLGRVLDGNNSSAPKPDVRVSCADVSFAVARNFGISSTNREGYYRIGFTVLEGIETTYNLRFTFTHEELSAPVEQTLTFSPVSKLPIPVTLAFVPLPSTSKTIASTGVSVPADVTAYLASQSITITRLEDIRRLGALKNLPPDQVNTSNADLLKLDGLASLELLQDDVAKNNTLYTRGYKSITDIALAPKGVFVDANNDLFGDYGAGAIHYMAKAGHMNGVNQMAAKAGAAPQHQGAAPSAEGGARNCDCPDCKSGVSPLAYLADLLAFMKQHVLVNNGQINWAYLQSNFKQSFIGLRKSCSQMKERLCQNRIAAEVLRSYLISNPPTGGQATTLAAEEKEYLTQAYELLLGHLGTSYTELRLLRNSTDEKALQRLADRMGVVREHGGSTTLEQVLIDLSSTANIIEGQNAGNAKGLEQLFGLRDTTRNVFEVTPESKVEQWKKAKLREDWKKADGLHDPFWDVTDTNRAIILDPDVVTIDDIRDPGSSAAFTLWKKRRLWLDKTAKGLLNLTDDAVLVDIDPENGLIAAHGLTGVSLGTTNRISYFKAGSDDFDPAEEFTVQRTYEMNGSTWFKVAETIPDLSNGGTLTFIDGTPTPHTNAEVAQVPSVGKAVQKMMTPNTFSYEGFTIITGWSGADAATFMSELQDTLNTALQGSQGAIDAILAMGLTLASAARLIALYEKNNEALDDSRLNGGLELSEHQEAIDIMVAALKHFLLAEWRDEEDDSPGPALHLDPATFWPSLREPREVSAVAVNAATPLLDPDFAGSLDVPEVTARYVTRFDMTAQGTAAALTDADALDVLDDRKEQMRGHRDDFAADFDSDFESMLADAFGIAIPWGDDVNDTFPNYLGIQADLASADMRGIAEAYVAGTFRISGADFIFLVGCGTKVKEGVDVTQNERDRALDLLLMAFKSGTLHGHWVAQEHTPVELVEDTVQLHWKLRKAALPKWRASRARRDEWLQALAEHSARPIIDADLIGPGDLHMPEDGNTAYGLFDARWRQMHGNAEYPGTAATVGTWLRDIGAHAGFALASTADLDALTKAFLGHAEDNLAEIFVQQEDGVDIRPRVAQLNLTPGEFNRLMVCRDILAASGTLTGEEKSIIQRILATVQKRRSFFAYRLEEIAAGITLSQDHFKVREQAVVSFPPQPDAPLTEWLAQERDLILWRRNLKGRVEQEKSVLDDWQQALFEVDEAMMVHLRDAMVRAVSPAGQNLVASARNLGDQLLIDLENNCCYKTNRVAAAIETLQQFLWKIRTGDILAHYPAVRYQGEDFDEAWTWMGSYANWRAAMFVFLYPENVLHPSLRKNTTPAFREVVEATRNNRRFGPNDACEVAHRYKDYIQDISELDVKCAQQAHAFVGEDRCGAPRNAKRKLSFVFAQAKGSKRPYFTMADTNDLEQVAQTTFWTPIPGIEGEPTLRGCDLYINWDERINHVYLFYTLKGNENKSKFFALRFSLESMQWETEPIEFEVSQDELTTQWQTEAIPFNPEAFDMSIRALCVLKNSEAWQSPTLAISLMHDSGIPYTFSRYLAADGKSLISGNDWDLWMTSFRNPKGWSVGDVLDYWYYYPPEEEDWDWTKVLHYYLLGKWDAANEVWTTAIIRKCGGFPPLESYQQIAFGPYGPATPGLNRLHVDNVGKRFYAYAREVSTGHAWDVSVWEFDNTKVFEHEVLMPNQFATPCPAIKFSGLLDVSGIITQVVNKVTPMDASEPMVVYQRRYDSQIFIGRAGHDDNEGHFVLGPAKFRLSTRLFTQPSIGPAAAEADQDLNRAHSEDGWALNVSGNPRLVVPVMEAWYFVPLQIALQLQVNGYYTEALDWFRSLYDFRRPLADRKISYLLTQEESINTDAQRMADWYADPLNPHAIAATRRHTYTRYTILSIVNCLLAYADAEFTADNSESVPRARELYEDALGLMKLLIAEGSCADEAVHDALGAAELAPSWRRVWEETLDRLQPLTEWSGYAGLLEDIVEALEGTDPVAVELAEVNDLIDAALAAFEHPTIEEVLDAHVELVVAASASALAGTEADLAMQQLVHDSAMAYERAMTTTTGLPKSGLESETIPWLIDDREPSGFDHGHEMEYISPGREHGINAYTEEQPAAGFYLNNPFPNVWLSGVPFSFCVVPNPIAGALVMKAEVELWKIHNCMNIAGMVRELDPFAAPTDSTTGIPVIGAAGGSIAIPSARTIPPSAYRYRTIVERARQLVAMAQQVEAAFLATLEKLDAERYSQLRAEQDIETSKANIKLQDLKINEANSGVRLAELQRERAQLQVDGLNGMIAAGLLGAEVEMIDLYVEIAKLTIQLNTFNLIVQSLGFTQEAFAANAGAIGASVATAAARTALAGVSTIFQNNLANLNKDVQINAILSSFERRKQEWEFQLTLANQDVKIGDQQIKLANDRLRIVGQERTIAVLQNEHARATLDFLKNKFTSAELYEWMSRVLEDAYSWFLQEATAMAILAERQLAFERQLDLPPFIRSDYWIVDGGSMGGVDMTGQGVVDRRGLTGSTRLLKDLTELDQYAFSTNSPKLQLTKTIALSELAPEELIALRDTGIARFYTTQEQFDRDYPGHYLRLIKRVSVTVIALTPPTKGIRATLTNGGGSNVVVGGTIFQERVIKRYPEVVAFSSGVGDHGVFQLQPDGEFLHPFEGSGVETGWEFRMEKAANPFDYNSIADVLFTIEYESLNSFIYRNTIAQKLNQEGAPSAIAISLKNNLPDQWFDLHNPPEPTTNYQVSFQINQRDLAPNLSAPYSITRAVAYAVMKRDPLQASEEGAGEFRYGIALNRETPQDNHVAFSTDGIAILNGSNIVDVNPIGTWQLGFRKDDGATLPNPFADKLVEDIFIILIYKGESTDYLLV